MLCVLKLNSTKVSSSCNGRAEYPGKSEYSRVGGFQPTIGFMGGGGYQWVILAGAFWGLCNKNEGIS